MTKKYSNLVDPSSKNSSSSALSKNSSSESRRFRIRDSRLSAKSVGSPTGCEDFPFRLDLGSTVGWEWPVSIRYGHFWPKQFLFHIYSFNIVNIQTPRATSLGAKGGVDVTRKWIWVWKNSGTKQENLFKSGHTCVIMGVMVRMWVAVMVLCVAKQDLLQKLERFEDTVRRPHDFGTCGQKKPYISW